MKMAGSLMRVALQHTIYDELLINANGGYQGGVRFDGPVHLSGDLSVQGGVDFDGNVQMGGNLGVLASLQMQVGSKLLQMLPDKKVQFQNSMEKKSLRQSHNRRSMCWKLFRA